MSQAPLPRRSADEQTRLEAVFAELFEQRIVFNRVLGLRVLQMGGEVGSPMKMRFDMRPELVGHYLHGRLHGGVISAALDATGGNAVMWAMSERHPHESTDEVVHRFARVGTIDLRVDYLRQGLGTHFIASAEVLRLGSRVASVQMRLENDTGLLIATGAAAYIVG